MTKRIKLTEDDIELEFRPDDEEFNENYQKYCIIIKDNDDKSAEVIKQQILDDQAIVKEVRFLAEIRYDEELLKIIDNTSLKRNLKS